MNSNSSFELLDVFLHTAVCVDLAGLGAKPKPQNQLLLFANFEPKIYNKYNYVVRLPIVRPVKEVYHISIFMYTAFQFIFCMQGQRNAVHDNTLKSDATLL